MATVFDRFNQALNDIERIRDEAQLWMEGDETTEIELPDGDLINSVRKSLKELADAAAANDGLAQDLQSTEPGKGASLVVLEDGTTVQQRLPIATLADLQAAPAALQVEGLQMLLISREAIGDSAAGPFVWRPGDQSANVAADEVTAGAGDGGIWVAPDSDLTGASGAWQRQRDAGTFHVAWYGTRETGSDVAPNFYACVQAAVAAGGGRVICEAGAEYTVNTVARPLNWATETVKIHIEGRGATLVQANTGTSAYNMVIPGSNWVIEDLPLKGYVDSGTDHTDVVPAWSFGYRIDGNQRNVEIRRSPVDNIPYDGFLIAGNADGIRLIDCEGGQNQECYRNTVAVAGSGSGKVTDNIRIWGGKYAKAKLRPAIDLEPDSGGINNFTIIGGGVHLTGPLDIIASSNKTVVVDGVTLDGPDAVLIAYQYQYLSLDNINFINGADLKGAIGLKDQGASGTSATAEVSESTTRLGNIRGLGTLRNTKNLLDHSYNTLDSWTVFSSGTGTGISTPNVDVGPHGGIEIDSTDKALTYKKTITGLLGDTIYSVGGYANIISGNQTVVIQERDSGGALLAYYTVRGGEDGRFNALIKTKPTTDRFQIVFGEHNVSTSNARYGYFFISEGLREDWVPHPLEREGPLWSAAPSAGTWEDGRKVYNGAPSAGGVEGWMWLDAAAAWKSFGSIET